MTRPATVTWPGIDTELHLSVHADNDRHVSERIASEGVWEPFETQLICHLLRPGDLVADCGANLGWYTLIAAALGATVVAFEPLPKNAALLRVNVTRNGFDAVVEVNQIGLGAIEGTAMLELSAVNQGDHRVVPVASGRKEIVEIAVRTLDSVLAGRRPSLLKLDTQGSEVAILRGGRSAWVPVAGVADPVIVIEFWPYGLEQCGASVDDLLDLLEELVDITHRCFEIHEWRTAITLLSPGDLRRMASEGGYSPTMKGFTNLLLVPLGRVDEVAEYVDPN